MYAKRKKGDVPHEVEAPLPQVDVPCESSVEQGNDLDDLTSEIQAKDHALVACRNFMSSFLSEGRKHGSCS
jgi:hypothetical protein